MITGCPKKEFGRASPGVSTQVRKLASLGHPYRLATTSAGASVHCFVNLPRKSLARDDKVRGGVSLCSCGHLKDAPLTLSSRPERSVVEGPAVLPQPRHRLPTITPS